MELSRYNREKTNLQVTERQQNAK